MIRSLFEVTPLFILAIVIGVFGSVLYFMMRARVAKAGIPVKFYVTGKETKRILRLYKELAHTKGWSLWPITGYWISLVVIILLGLMLVWSGR